jgi:uncharacterized membrane protein YgaE (UPF0421/DUF939 family)
MLGVIGTNLTAGAGGTGTGIMGMLGSTFYTYGASLVTILTAVIGIGVAYLVFRFGWKKVKGSTH